MAGEWTSINLGDVCTKIGSGATPRGGSDVYLEKGPYALIRSQNVYNDGFHHDGLAYIGEKHASELDGVEIQKDDVLLNITGDSVARACQVDPHVLPARVNQHVAIIRPDPERLDPRFLRYFLVSPDMQTKLLSWAGSGGTRNALTKGMIESFDVPAPEDIDEQRAIAHILGTLDDKIELNRRMSETLEAMARALFQSWFVDFDPVRAKAEGRDPGLPQPLADLFPDSLEDSELGEIPRGWEVKAIKCCCVRVQNGGTPRRDEPSYWSNGDIPWLTSGEVRQSIVMSPEGYITEAGLATSSAKWVDPLSTVVALYGATAGEVSLVATRLTTNQAICSLIPKDRYAFFNYLSMRNAISDLKNKAVGSAQQNISKAIVEETLTIFPPIAVIKGFACIVEPLIMKWISNLGESRTLAALRDALLPKLISGELRVKDAEQFLKERGL
jgi:type I restriction enzyme S subunit